MPLTESSWQRGQTRRPPPPERDSQGEPGTAAATLRPGPGTTARRSALPFRLWAAPRRGSPAAVRPGTGPPRGTPCPPRSGCPGISRRTLVPPSGDKLPSSGAPRPRRLAGSSLARLPWSPAAGALARRGEVPPCPHQPRAPSGRLAVPAPPLQQSRRPGGDPARGREWRRGAGARGRHPWAGRGQRQGAAGTWRAEKGEESVLLSARKPPLLVLTARLPRPERGGRSGWRRRGRRGWQGGRRGLAGGLLPYLCPE